MRTRMLTKFAALSLALAVLPLVVPDPSPAAVTNGKIAFVREADVWVMDDDGSNQTNLTSSSALESDPAWSPDGTRIAFTRQPVASNFERDVWVMDADGTGQTNLTNSPASPDRDPDWSPNGARIVFISDRAFPNPHGAYVMNADGTGATLLRAAPFHFSEDGWADPTWSPDGTRIALTGIESDSIAVAVLSAVDGAGSTIAEAGSRGPTWSPDSLRIAFASDNGKLVATDPAGGGRTEIASEGVEPSWSPDGARIAYIAFGDVLTIGADGTGVTRLTSDVIPQESQPDWAVTPAPVVVPALSIDDVTVVEGAAGMTAAVFTVTLSAAGAGPITVQYATSDGTASAPGDYASTAGPLTFAAGETSKTISVQITGDTELEFDEAFSLTLSFAVGATIADPTGVGTIDNDDPGELMESSVAAGGTLTSDGEGDGATPTDPLETAVTTPNAGTVSIAEESAAVPPASGYSFLGQQVRITAPGASAASPLILVFTIDASILPAGTTAATLQIFRNGVLVPACTGAGASPDPCVADRVTLVDGDAQLTVYTSAASVWTFAPALVAYDPVRAILDLIDDTLLALDRPVLRPLLRASLQQALMAAVANRKPRVCLALRLYESLVRAGSGSAFTADEVAALTARSRAIRGELGCA